MPSIAITRFSAIARSVMISAMILRKNLSSKSCFSAIARSVMISAKTSEQDASYPAAGFSAIARSVMISALHRSSEIRSNNSVSVL